MFVLQYQVLPSALTCLSSQSPNTFHLYPCLMSGLGCINPKSYIDRQYIFNHIPLGICKVTTVSAVIPSPHYHKSYEWGCTLHQASSEGYRTASLHSSKKKKLMQYSSQRFSSMWTDLIKSTRK